jgi:hypothetical protein
VITAQQTRHWHATFRRRNKSRHPHKQADAVEFCLLSFAAGIGVLFFHPTTLITRLCFVDFVLHELRKIAPRLKLGPA